MIVPYFFMVKFIRLQAPMVQQGFPSGFNCLTPRNEGTAEDHYTFEEIFLCEKGYQLVFQKERDGTLQFGNARII